MEPGFTSNEVAELTGISLRQLQWWDEKRLVVPRRDGRNRTYSCDDLAEVAVICELRERGFSLQKVRKVVRFLQKQLGKRLVQTATAASEFHLLTDGQNIYLQDSARAVVDLLKNAKQPMFTVCLSDTIQRILPELAHPRPGSDSTRSSGSTQETDRKASRSVGDAGKVGRKRSGSVRHLSVRKGKAS